MILPVVEGHGEVEAVPLLIRRVLGHFAPERQVLVARPIRVKRDGMIRAGGIERTMALVGQQSASGDGVLILLDADDACPRDLGESLRKRASAARPDREIRVVLANREFEGWFLASARSLRGRRGLPDDLEPPADPEQIRDAKGWLSSRTPPGRSYRPTIDQAALAQLFDLEQAYHTRSFRKFVKDVVELASAS
jgi:hypothetical protein